MGGVKRCRDLRADRHGAGRRERASPSEAAPAGRSLDVPHREVQLFVELASVVDRDTLDARATSRAPTRARSARGSARRPLGRALISFSAPPLQPKVDARYTTPIRHDRRAPRPGSRGIDPTCASVGVLVFALRATIRPRRMQASRFRCVPSVAGRAEAALRRALRGEVLASPRRRSRGVPDSGAAGGRRPRAFAHARRLAAARAARLLLTRANEVVSADRLIDELWGDAAAGDATNALQFHVSQLRKALAPRGALITQPPGYLIRVAPERARPAALRAARRRGGARGARRRRATRLRGSRAVARHAARRRRARAVCADEIVRLEELRLVALELRFDADLASGATPSWLASWRRWCASIRCASAYALR